MRGRTVARVRGGIVMATRTLVALGRCEEDISDMFHNLEGDLPDSHDGDQPEHQRVERPSG